MSFPRRTPLSTSIRGRAQPFTRDRGSEQNTSQDNGISSIKGLPKPIKRERRNSIRPVEQEVGGERRESVSRSPLRTASLASSQGGSRTRKNPFTRPREPSMSRLSTEPKPAASLAKDSDAPRKPTLSTISKPLSRPQTFSKSSTKPALSGVIKKLGEDRKLSIPSSGNQDLQVASLSLPSEPELLRPTKEIQDLPKPSASVSANQPPRAPTFPKYSADTKLPNSSKELEALKEQPLLASIPQPPQPPPLPTLSNLGAPPPTAGGRQDSERVNARLSTIPSDASFNTVRRPHNYNDVRSSNSNADPLSWKSFDEGLDLDSRGGYGRQQNPQFGLPGAQGNKYTLPPPLPLPTMKRSCGHYEIVDADEARSAAKAFHLYGEHPRGPNQMLERTWTGRWAPVGIKDRNNVDATSPWSVGIGGSFDMCKRCKAAKKDEQKLDEQEEEEFPDRSKLRRSETKEGVIRNGTFVRADKSSRPGTEGKKPNHGSAFIRGTESPDEDLDTRLQERPTLARNTFPSMLAEQGTRASSDTDMYASQESLLRRTRSESDIQDDDPAWRREKARSDDRLNQPAENSRYGFIPFDAWAKDEDNDWQRRSPRDQTGSVGADLVDNEDIRPLLRNATQFEPPERTFTAQTSDHRFFERTSTPSVTTHNRLLASEFSEEEGNAEDSQGAVVNDMGRIFNRILLDQRAMLKSVIKNLESTDPRLSIGSQLAQKLSVVRPNVLANKRHLHMSSQSKDSRGATQGMTDSQRSMNDIIRLIDLAASDLGIDLHNASPMLKAHQNPPPLSPPSAFDGPSDERPTNDNKPDTTSQDRTLLKSFWEQWSSGDPRSGVQSKRFVQEKRKVEHVPRLSTPEPTLNARPLSPILSVSGISRDDSTPTPTLRNPRPAAEIKIEEERVARSITYAASMSSVMSEGDFSTPLPTPRPTQADALEVEAVDRPPLPSEQVQHAHRYGETPRKDIPPLPSEQLPHTHRYSVAGSVNAPPLPSMLLPHAHRYGAFGVGSSRAKGKPPPTPPKTPELELPDCELTRSELSLIDVHLPRPPHQRAKSETNVENVGSTAKSLERRKTGRVTISNPVVTPAPPQHASNMKDEAGDETVGLNTNEMTATLKHSKGSQDPTKNQIPAPLPPPPNVQQHLDEQKDSSTDTVVISPTPRRASTIKKRVNTFDSAAASREKDQYRLMYEQQQKSSTAADLPLSNHKRRTSSVSRSSTTKQTTPRPSRQPSLSKDTERKSSRQPSLSRDPPEIPTRRSTVRQSVSSIDAVSTSQKDQAPPPRRRSTTRVTVTIAQVPAPAAAPPTRQPTLPKPAQRTSTLPKPVPVRQKTVHGTQAPTAVSTNPPPRPEPAPPAPASKVTVSTSGVNPNPRYPSGGVQARKGMFEPEGGKGDDKREKGVWRGSGLEAKKVVQRRGVGVGEARRAFEQR